MSAMPKINASMLSENVGKLVCLVGKITEVSTTGDKLQVLSCDEQTINVFLRDKYEDRPGQCIQIIGTVKPDLSMVADKYITFSGTNIDYEMYNKLITKYLPKFPHLFQHQDSNTNEMNDWN